MQTSLIVKLTIAFILIAVITAGLVAIFIRLSSVDRLWSLIVDQQRSSLKESLIQFYSKNTTWENVEKEWPTIRHNISPHFPTPPPFDNGAKNNNEYTAPPPNDGPALFGLADAQGKIIIPINQHHPIGSMLNSDMTQEGTPIIYEGTMIGVIINAPNKPHFRPEEDLFIQRTTEALIYAVIGSIVVALIIGIILARTLTKPLQALTHAAHKISQGELEQEVLVNSKDEIGQLATAFNRMSREVARVNHLRRQMTADIAHELRTPLMVIAGYIESMKDGILQPTPDRLILIYTEIERLQSLVSDLRMLSQVDAGELSLHPQPIQPLALLQRVYGMFNQTAAKQQVSIKMDVADDLPTIYVDEDRMMQVLSNLFVNALRYTSAGGEIWLSGALLKGNVIITVRDTGCGIPKEDLPNIFDRFYRVDKSRTDSNESGLGLAIAKALVIAHSGTISAESVLGEYTAIHIHLKICES